MMARHTLACIVTAMSMVLTINTTLANTTQAATLGLSASPVIAVSPTTSPLITASPTTSSVIAASPKTSPVIAVAPTKSSIFTLFHNASSSDSTASSKHSSTPSLAPSAASSIVTLAASASSVITVVSTQTLVSTNSSTTNSSATNSSTTNSSSTNSTTASAMSSLSTLIPNTFYYNCTENGEIRIMNAVNSLSNIKIDYIKKSASNCSDPYTEEDGSTTIANCKPNTMVTIVLQTTNTTGILGGSHSKTFQISCDNVNVQPYLLNATATNNFGNDVAPTVISLAKAPSPITSLTMTIRNNNTEVQEATIGQVLTIAIKIPGSTTIKPTVCMASGNDNSVTLWQETGCQHDEELFGEKWRAESGEVRNTMYGFRFVGSSTSITITCTVRVCPEGYGESECDLSTCGSKKRKRITRLSEDVTIQKATTTLTIRDPLLTSGAGRRGHDVSIITGSVFASVVFWQMKFLKG